jgi:hypothetical protein
LGFTREVWHIVRRLFIVCCISVYSLGNVSTLFAQKSQSSVTDAGELHRLIQVHLTHKTLSDNPPSDTLDVSIELNHSKSPVIFSIPGFHSLGCGKCHEGESLQFKAADRMRRVLAKLKKIKPELGKVPLRQYIIQSWPDALLTPQQLAHTTFDTIRISPAAILIDSKVYREATHLHESLHLTQKFVGAANELEAYSLNIISDPRFLLLNFPYFEDTIKTFFIENFSEILNDFYARPIREQLSVPRETQWFLAPFNENQLKQLRQVIDKITPLLEEVSRLNQNYPKEFAYLSEQTGNPAILLEIVAARELPIVDSGLPEEIRRKAFSFFDLQINKKDNTRLGYKINRKKEAFLFIQNQLMIKDSSVYLQLYFEYIKKKFVKLDGKINLHIIKEEDFSSYILSKVKGLKKMISYKGMSQIEREGAKKLIKEILLADESKKALPNH